MLNYVWLGLLLLGIGAALTTDIIDQANNKYRNNEKFPVEIVFDQHLKKDTSKSYRVKITSSKESFNKFYGIAVAKDISQEAKLSFNPKKNKYSLFFNVKDGSPEIWKEMAKVSGEDDDLTGQVFLNSKIDSLNYSGSIKLEEIAFAKMKNVTNSAIDYAGISVKIALGLIGIMALWLGIMKIAEEAGLIKKLANAVRPITRWLFPDVPGDHPAIGSMIMNISANMIGLGNAATPFGLKAMEELDKLNPKKGIATNAMCTFLAINTAGLTLIPATAIAIRAAAGSSDPAIIIGTSFFGALCATTVGIFSAKVLEKFPMSKNDTASWVKTNMKGISIFIGLAVFIFLLTISGITSGIVSLLSFINPDLLKTTIQIISIVAIPFIIFSFVLYGAIKKVKIYEVFVEGAKEGFNIAVKIIPYLVAMLVAIGIFRAGGALEFLTTLLNPITSAIGMPAEAMPMAFMRPLSGSGSLGVMAEIIAVHGPDSFIGILVSTMMGSTETTFYVLAVYFGAVNIQKTRHALAAGLLADLAGMLGALFIVRLLFG